MSLTKNVSTENVFNLSMINYCIPHILKCVSIHINYRPNNDEK